MGGGGRWVGPPPPPRREPPRAHEYKIKFILYSTQYSSYVRVASSDRRLELCHAALVRGRSPTVRGTVAHLSTVARSSKTSFHNSYK